ncbi:hypothetical protein PG991_013477 [Apiospora marii]|uniref:BTB domain-containing protein n=1 Tax=Apiospora marii TaxID=335849 RepID=A0ABR1R633_9PEZI
MAGLSPNVYHDERLFRTGEDSDVLVRCGDQSWPLHKVILSSRCLYFRSGLKASWVLGNPLYYCIDEQDVQAVHWIIHWIYSACLPQELSPQDSSTFTACLRLLRCSRVFLLPELTADAQYHLYRISQNMIIEAQTAFYVADDSDEQFEMSDLDGFFDGVKMVYEDEHLKNDRGYFTGVVKGAHFWPLLDTNFKNKAEAQQAFWIDVMSLQQEAITNGAYWPYIKPEKCHICEHSPWTCKDRPRSTHWATLKLVKGKCQATCNHCASEEGVDHHAWTELSEEDEEERKLPPVKEEKDEEASSSSASGSA